ncbi:MAG: AraC family transcriptional regulator [bacterium]|nr:AraC family transcriptional regulator [bacterium]
MFYDKELTFLQKSIAKCRIRSTMIHPHEEIDDAVYKNLGNIFKSGNEKNTFIEYFPEIKSKTIYRVTDMFCCRYLYLKLPHCDPETVLFIGPYLYEDISLQQIMESGEQIGASPKQLKILEFYYASLPIVKDENYILAILNTFAEYIWDGSDNFVFTDVNHAYSAESVEKLFGVNDPTYSNPKDIDAMEKRYEFENELITAVTQGNIRKAEQMMINIPMLAFETRIPDQLRNIKNYCIIMNTLFRKAAESGGVHPVHLDSVSSEFARRIENLHAIAAAQRLMLEILRAYCDLVKQHIAKNYSPLIKKAIILIESDLLGDLSLRTLSQISNVSPEYFSVCFKKETGKTLTQFVTSKRIEYAKHLLKSTNLQIQTIAQHCGILDLHYFCRVFKKIVGKTPSEYRNSLMFN